MDKQGLHSNPNSKQDRRTFLKSSSIVALGASFPSVLPAQRSTLKKSTQLRVGIVGGRFGSNFYAFKLHPDCEVVAVSDLRPKRLARMVEVFECTKTYPSLEDMVKDPNIDAIAVLPEHLSMWITRPKS